MAARHHHDSWDDNPLRKAHQLGTRYWEESCESYFEPNEGTSFLAVRSEPTVRAATDLRWDHQQGMGSSISLVTLFITLDGKIYRFLSIVQSRHLTFGASIWPSHELKTLGNTSTLSSEAEQHQNNNVGRNVLEPQPQPQPQPHANKSR